MWIYRGSWLQSGVINVMVEYMLSIQAYKYINSGVYAIYNIWHPDEAIYNI